MNKVKFKVNIKIISLLVLILAFLMLPFGQFEPTTAEGEYQISTEQGLKDWLQNTDNIQTNNPNAILTSDITLDWGNVAPSGAGIQSGSVLNGQNFTISIAGGDVTAGTTKNSYFGLFVTTINNGTLKNVVFNMLNNRYITIDGESANRNERLFSGFVAAQIMNSTIENVSVTLDKNLTFYNDGIGTHYTDKTSNHFGIIAGWLEGNSIIKNCNIIQTQNSTITLESNNQADNYMRIGFIASDSYKSDNGTPQILNVNIERWGNLALHNRNIGSDGNCLYGIVVADMSTQSGNDTNHAVIIDGVIYNGLGGSVTNQITYTKGGDIIRSYFTGRIGISNTNCSISNVYSYVEFSDTSSLAVDTGVAIIPSGVTIEFSDSSENQIIFNSTGEANEFIWAIERTSASNINTYNQLALTIVVDKFNTEISVGQDNLNITLGQIIDSAIVGFESEQVVYSGVPFQNVRIRIGDEIIEDDDFDVSYADNLNAYATSGKNATFSLQYLDREDGIFISSKNYFIEKEGLSYDNQQMTINQAQLSFSYTPGDIYTNQLVIDGLVNNEMVTIDDVKYGNGSVSFDCLNNSQVKSITFEDGIISTNYNISQSGLSDLSFTVTPKTISVSEGVTILNADDESAVFAEGLLTIYSKTYQSIELSFAQNAGYLNRVDLTSSEGHSFKISSSLNDNVMSNTISSDTANELHYLDSIVLNESLQKVAVKIDIDTSLISNLTINGQRPVKYGDYLLIDADFGEELEFVITLLDDYQDYTISYSIASEPSQVEGNSFKINAISQTNNIMLITISITAPSV